MRTNIIKVIAFLIALSGFDLALFPISNTEAAVTITQVARATATTTAASITINKPTGTTTNDVMIMILATNDNNAAPASGFTSAGWTLITGAGSANNITFSSLYKIAGASEPTNYTATITSGGGRSAGAISTYRSTSPTVPVDVTNAAAATACNITAPSVTTTGVNDFLISAYAAAGSNGLGAPTLAATGAGIIGADSFSTNAGGTIFSNPFIAIAQGDEQLGAPGATGNRTGSGGGGLSGTSACVGNLIAIRPHNYDWNQSASRWFTNNDSQDLLSVDSNPTAGDDKMLASVINTGGDRVFWGGYESSNGNDWRIEERRLSTGELCSVGGCGTIFGTNGVLSENVSAGDDQITGLALDTTNNLLYVAGYDSSPGNNEWRIERRSSLDGSLDTTFGTGGIITENVTGGADQIAAIALDTANNVFYVAGYDNTGSGQWRLEQRSTTDGSLVAGFATSGVYTNNLSNKLDNITALAVDSAGGNIFVGGVDNSPAGSPNQQWRVEKLATSNGALAGGFGTAGAFTDFPVSGTNVLTSLALDTTNSVLYIGGYDPSNGIEWRVDKISSSTAAYQTGFGTSGALTINPSAGDDELNMMALDISGGNLYLGGFDSSTGAGQWRIQKVTTSAGANVSGFGTSGVISSNSSSSMDQIMTMAIDTTNNLLYAGGYSGNNSNQWRMERRATSDGAKSWPLVALAAQDTAYSATADQAMRLRVLLHNTTDNLRTTDTSEQFKLRYSPKVGTCDTLGVGESYVDVAATGTPTVAGFDILYKDNPNPTTTDGGLLATQTGDPAHASDTTIPLSYEEAASFTTNSTAVNFGQDIMFDVSLQDNDSYGSYCFQVWYNSGTTDIYEHSTVSEIVFCRRGRTDQDLRHGTYFCEGNKQPFFWN